MTECYKWDFTLSNESQRDLNILKDNLRDICKKWVFQEEKSESGYQHYQGRISLIKKKRLTALIKLFKTLPEWQGVHFSPTSKEVHKDNSFSYVMKLDTRVSGPFSDADAIPVKPTKQMTMFNKWELYPYQQSLEIIATEFCLRSIDFIYDQDGNIGKSLFSEYLEFKNLAEEVPPFRLMDDIFQWVASRPIKPCYIFDMPRGMKKDKLADFYSGVEVIKNGVAYDKRYSAKKIRFDRPRIFIFSNTLPQFDLMSKDRWKVWTIYNKELKKYSIDDDLWKSDYKEL